MATISLTVPADKLDRVVHALCKSAGLEETAANAKKAVIEHVKATVRNVENAEAEQAAVEALTPSDADDVAS